MPVERIAVHMPSQERFSSNPMPHHDHYLGEVTFFDLRNRVIEILIEWSLIWSPPSASGSRLRDSQNLRFRRTKNQRSLT